VLGNTSILVAIPIAKGNDRFSILFQKKQKTTAAD